MDNSKYPRKKGEQYPPIPGKPLPKKTEDTQNSLYHYAVMMFVGLVLCLIMGVHDHLSPDTVPATDTTDTIEYIE